MANETWNNAKPIDATANPVGAKNIVIGILNGTEDDIIPIGFVQNFSFSQNKLTQRVFEVGSGVSRIAAGPNIVMANATRLVTDMDTLTGLVGLGGMYWFEFDNSNPVFDIPVNLVVSFYNRDGGLIQHTVIRGCIITAENFSVNAGDVVTFENVAFEGSKVENLGLTSEGSTLLTNPLGVETEGVETEYPLGGSF